MSFVLLDTDVFSFLLRPRDTRGELYRPLVANKRIVLSFVSVGELYAWVSLRSWGPERVAKLESALRTAVILPADIALCKEFGRVKATLPAGRVVGVNDLWIAVCAIRHSIPLLTHNQRHFDGIPRLRLLATGSRG